MSRDLETVAWRDEIRSRLPAKRHKRPLHFVDLNHGQRVVAAQALCNKPMRSMCIVANKPVIPAGIYNDKNQLYFYLCRYLIERISWLCRDMRRLVQEGDGRVKIVFSRRGGMSYDDFRAYLERLKSKQDDAIQINWDIVDISAIEAVDHATRAGLQISDVIASSVTAAVEQDFYGNCERRYAEILRPIIYNRNGNYLSYGMKLYPWAERLNLNDQQNALIGLFQEDKR